MLSSRSLGMLTWVRHQRFAFQKPMRPMPFEKNKRYLHTSSTVFQPSSVKEEETWTSTDATFASLSNDTPPEIFAVVQVSGKQHRIVPGDILVTEKLGGLDVGESIRLRKVLLAGTKHCTAIGQPLVREVKVVAEVEEQTLSEKVMVFKKKRRKGYRRLVGWRHPITVLRIHDIEADFENIAEPSHVVGHTS